MPLRSLACNTRRALRRSVPLQIGLLGGFWFLGDQVARRLALPIPGAILGLAAVLALLAGGWLHPASLRRGAAWMLAEMLLFFVPAVLALLDHRDLFSFLGLKILAAILLGTLVVMVVTGLTVELFSRLEASRGRA